MKKQLILLLSLSFLFFANAQKKCSNYFYTIENEDLLVKIQNRANQMSLNSRSAPYQIPLFFHIVTSNGRGNLSDSIINGGLKRLNEYYNATNWDLINLHPNFQSIIGDMQIEFKLAHTKTDGTFTNGIERIDIPFQYLNSSILHNLINSNTDSQYIHVWLANMFPQEFFETNLAYNLPGNTYNRCTQNFRIKPFSVFSRSAYYYTDSLMDDRQAIAHELAHVLGLTHTWGNNNNPEVACGDDGVLDTPPTNGYLQCISNKNIIQQRDSTCWNAMAYPWDSNTVSNVQNIMEYSYCSVNFTQGQVQLVHATLEDTCLILRDIVSATNIANTGVNNPLQAIPKAYFVSNKQVACIGDTVIFYNYSYNGTVQNSTWGLDGGILLVDSNGIAKVVFNNAGWKTISLKVDNSFGADSIENRCVYINDINNTIPTPNFESFEDSIASSKWISKNIFNNQSFFDRTNSTGFLSSHSFELNNFSQKNADVDGLYSPFFNTSNLSNNATLSFYYAVSKPSFIQIDSINILNIFASKDCGHSFYLLKRIPKNQLFTDSSAIGSFAPSQPIDWRKISIPLVSTINGYNMLSSNVQFYFEFIKSDSINNLYIDHINVGDISPIRIEGNTHLYTQQTCIDDSLYPGAGLNNIKVNLKNNNNQIEYQAYSNILGNYVFELNQITNYTVEVDTNNLLFSIDCPVMQTNYSNLNIFDSISSDNNFGLRCTNFVDFTVNSIYANRFRPSLYSNVNCIAGNLTKLHYNANCGNNSSGTVTTTFSGAVQYVSPAPNALAPTVSGNTLTFTIANLDSLKVGDLDFILQTDSFATFGSQVCITSVIHSDTIDANPSNDSLTMCFNVVNSFDPNEKTVYPKTITSDGDWLTYTIQFQNTGNDTAYTVVVKDTLPQDLVAESFQYLASSHKNIIQIKGQEVVFTFPRINLVDSATNEPLSHGWVQFKIKTKNNLPPTFNIANRAAIFFDFNAPIFTNYAVTTQPTGIQNLKNEIAFSVFPNPFTQQFTILTNEKEKVTANIMDMMDKTIATKDFQQQTIIDLSAVAKGIYLVQLTNSKGEKGVYKLVKE